VSLGLRLGDGTFGAVYSATLGASRAVVVKKPKNVPGAMEGADAEDWMNRRIRRSISLRPYCAPYIGTYADDALRAKSGTRTLVWDLKGKDTLENAICDRNFPLCLEEELFGREGTGAEKQRQLKVVKRIMSNIVQGLKQFHKSGIVHRDVKPSNLVLMGRQYKFVDFGAATDLRVGKNYDPEQSLLDPGYSPPEQYIMPESTPIPPVEPVAAALSPFIWTLNRPDLFDSYSVGIILLRLACPTLRPTNAVAPTGKFQRDLLNAEYDLDLWREKFAGPQWDFSLLDMNGGAGWDLASKLVCKRNARRRGRLSAQEILLHPFMLFA